IRTRGGCSYGWEEGLFLCRSTASVRTGRARIRTRGGCSYGREEGCFCVGAPPRCEPGGHAFAPGAGAPTIRGRGCFCVGAPPRCEPRGHPSPVIGAFYGVHCSKSPAGRVQSGFQSPSPRGRKLMSERGV